ncbi:hypothetical protein ABK040_014899 [Willaertia magna]
MYFPNPNILQGTINNFNYENNPNIVNNNSSIYEVCDNTTIATAASSGNNSSNRGEDRNIIGPPQNIELNKNIIVNAILTLVRNIINQKEPIITVNNVSNKLERYKTEMEVITYKEMLQQSYKNFDHLFLYCFGMSLGWQEVFISTGLVNSQYNIKQVERLKQELAFAFLSKLVDILNINYMNLIIFIQEKSQGMTYIKRIIKSGCKRQFI